MSTPLIGVLALQGDVREHRAMLERAGAETLAVRRPEEVGRVDGIVIPGGESTTISKLARTFGVLDPLREALRSGLPGFGTCAGMIMLADHIEAGVAGQETLGGLDVVVRRNAFGRQVDSFEADLELDVDGHALQRPFRAMFIRAPWVEKVGQSVEVVARVSVTRSTSTSCCTMCPRSSRSSRAPASSTWSGTSGGRSAPGTSRRSVSTCSVASQADSHLRGAEHHEPVRVRMVCGGARDAPARAGRTRPEHPVRRLRQVRRSALRARAW